MFNRKNDIMWILVIEGVLLAIAAPELIQEGNVQFLALLIAGYCGMCISYAGYLIMSAIRVVWSYLRNYHAG